MESNFDNILFTSGEGFMSSARDDDRETMRARNFLSLPTYVPQFKKWKYGLLTKEKIREISVVVLKDASMIYDPLMGNMISKEDTTRGLCKSCNKPFFYCPGHLGRIEFPYPVYHPLLKSEVKKILERICLNCAYPILVKGKECVKCSTPYTKITDVKKQSASSYKTSDEINATIVTDKKKQKVPSYKFMSEYNGVKEFIPIDKLARLLEILDDIPEFESKYKPSSLLIYNLAVIPPRLRSRPIIQFNTDSDVSSSYKDIINTIAKINNPIGKNVKNREIDSNSDELYCTLMSNIITLMTNTINTKKNLGSKNDPKSSIETNIKTKKGMIRYHLGGKLAFRSGRNVIGGNSMLKIDEIGMPETWRTKLTKIERVSSITIDRLQKLVDSDEIMVHCFVRNGKKICVHNKRHRIEKDGDIKLLSIYDKIVTPTMTEDGEIGEEIITYVTQDNINDIQIPPNSFIVHNDEIYNPLIKDIDIENKLQIGDYVHRYVQENDWTGTSRSPSIKIAGFIGYKVKLTPFRNLGLNHASIDGFAADFDGDEMNIHFTSTVAGDVELEHNSSYEERFISEENSEPNPKFIQDVIMACYFMSNLHERIEQIPVAIFKRITKRIKAPNFRKIYNGDCDLHSSSEYLDSPLLNRSGRSFFSLFLPDDYHLDYHYNHTFLIEKNENNVSTKKKIHVQIKNGVLIKGELNKSVIHKIMTHIYFEHGWERASDYITDVEFACNDFFEWHGFTTPLRDCYTKNTARFAQIFQEAYNLAIQFEEISSDIAKEAQISNALENAMIDCKNILIEELQIKNNSILQSIAAGSKGTIENMNTMLISPGQLNINQKRYQLTLPGNRSLVSFQSYNLIPLDIFFQQGFISRSYFRGLTAEELFLCIIQSIDLVKNRGHATKETGYSNRRTTKRNEDIISTYDESLRHIASGNIITLQYGKYNFDITKLLKLSNGEYFCIDIDRELTRLNRDLETFIKIGDHPNSRNVEYYSKYYVTITGDQIDEIVSKIPIKTDKAIRIATRIHDNIVEVIQRELTGKKIYSPVFNLLKDKILDSIEYAFIKPGQSIGMQANQSIIGPITQMTMKQFHFTGQSISKRSTVDQMDSILLFSATSTSAKEKNKKSNCYITLEYNHDMSLKKIRDSIGCELVKIVLGKLIDTIKISEGSLIIKLSDKYMYNYRIYIGRICDKIYNFPKYRDLNISFDRQHIEDNVLVIRSSSIHEVFKHIQQIPISGIDNISNYEIMIIKTNPKRRFEIITEGSNLQELIYIFGYKNVRTDNLHEIFTLFGIIGLVSRMKHLANQILNNQIGQQHIDTIIDNMSSRGVFYSINRSGKAKDPDSSINSNISFETPKKHILVGAINGTVDNIKDISSCNIAQKTIRLGQYYPKIHVPVTIIDA